MIASRQIALVVGLLSIPLLNSCQSSGDTNTKRPEDTHTLLDAIEEAVEKDSPIRWGDLGKRHGYIPGDEQEALICRLMARPGELQMVIESRYITADRDALSKRPIEMVFALIDILLRLEDGGMNTRAQRSALWQKWQVTFESEMGSMYRPRLDTYEEEILVFARVSRKRR